MRFQLFIFNVLCLCYVISAFSNKDFEETKLELNRPKRTLILTSMIKKIIWRKFSNFINLPITRKPPKIVNFTTERNSIPSTKQSFESKSNSIDSNPSSNPIAFGDYPLNDNKNNSASGGVTSSEDTNNKQKSSSYVGQHFEPVPISPETQNDVSNSVEFPLNNPDQYINRHNDPKEKQSNIYGPSTSNPTEDQYYDYESSGPYLEQNYGPPSGPDTQNYRAISGRFLFSAPEGINNLRSNRLGKQQFNNDVPPSVPEEQNYEPASGEVSNDPRKQFNNYVQPYSHPSLEQSYESTSSPSAEQNYRPPSGPEERNYEPYYRGFPVSALEENIDRRNHLRKQQSNSYEPPSDLSVEQNFGPTSRPSTEQNYGQPSSLKEEIYATTPTTKDISNSDTNQHNGPKLQQSEKEHQDYSHENNHKSVNQLGPTISNSGASRYTGRKNSDFNNFQQQFQLQSNEENNPALFSNTVNFAQQTNPSPSPFLINYPHHQHYQQLIPSVNKLSNSIQYADIPQNNYYQHEIVNHKEDSSDLNQFNQPLLNFYSPPKQYY